MKKLSLLLIAIILGVTGCSSAFQNLKSQADKGDAKSQYNVGLDYYLGTKEIKSDKTLGLEYLEKSATQNYVPALMKLGIINQKNKNYTKAVQYYEKAKAHNYGPAYGNLGIMYRHGLGVEKNLERAEKLYINAHQNGDYLAKRNLAVLYKIQKKYKQSEEAFIDTIFAKTHKKNSYSFKQMVCLELMNMNYENNNLQKAYSWGATAILAGLFDEKVNNAIKHLNRFDTISNKLTQKEKDMLSKTILENHYGIFQKYEYYFQKYPELKSDDGVVRTVSNQNIHLIGYLSYKNRITHQRINYFKTKNDDNSKISLAIEKLKVASSYIKLGAIIPQYGLALTQIEEAKKILDMYSFKNLNLLKNNINNKIMILKNIKDYQYKQSEIKRESNKF